MSASAITQALLSLPIAERAELADQLYASVPENWQKEADQAWLDEAEKRSAEMDLDPTVELSHEQFLAVVKASGFRS